MPTVTIKVRTDGPYLVTGPIELVTAAGEPIPFNPEKPVALCRCGASVTKPFCDGTHSRIGFRGAVAARREADAAADKAADAAADKAAGDAAGG